jgi:hypothetical protein
VNRIDQETEKEARAHNGCRAIQEEEEEEISELSSISISAENSLKFTKLFYVTGQKIYVYCLTMIIAEENLLRNTC